MDMHAEETLAKYRSSITPEHIQHTQSLLDVVARMDRSQVILFADLVRMVGAINIGQWDKALACSGLFLAAAGGLLQVYQVKDKEVIPTLWGDV